MEGTGEGMQDQPQDAYELGRLAAAKLKEHNETLSYELPNALQTLFSDTEFQEAIIDSGVVTNQRQTLTPIASYQVASLSSNSISISSPDKVANRRGQRVRRGRGGRQKNMSPVTEQEDDCTLAIASEAEAQHHTKTASASFQGVGSGRKVEEKQVLEGDEGQGSQLSKCRRIDTQPWQGQEEVVATTMQVADGIDISVESTNEIVPHFVVVDVGGTDEGESEGIRLNIDREHFEVKVGDTLEFTGEDVNCLCCNGPLIASEPISDSNARENCFLRDLLWLSLGMNKFYDRKSLSVPFCENCCSKIKQLSNICEQVAVLEEEFNTIRQSICEGIVSNHINMTKAAGTLLSNGNGAVKAAILKRIGNRCSEIRPGSQLLKEVSRFAAETESENQSTAADANSEADGDENSKEAVVTFECRFCDTTCPTKRTMTAHEKTHIVKGKFNCEICSKTFTSWQSRKSHMKTHKAEREKPYGCKLCGKSFTSKGNLDDHARRHTGFRPLQCTICSVRYFVMRHVRAHFLKRHPDIDPDKHVRKLPQPNAGDEMTI